MKNKKSDASKEELKLWNERLIREGFLSENISSTTIQPQKIGLETKYVVVPIDISNIELTERNAYIIMRYNDGRSIRAIERELKSRWPQSAIARTAINNLIRKYGKGAKRES